MTDYVGAFEGTIQIGDHNLTFQDLLNADEALNKKAEALPCEDGWSLIEWYSRLKATDEELIAIAWADVCDDDQSSQWEGFPAWTHEQRLEAAAKIYSGMKDAIEGAT